MKFFGWLTLCALLILARAVFAGEPAHLPPEAPVSSTGFFCKTPDKDFLLVLMVLTYKDGTVIRIDHAHLYGLETYQEVIQYAALAADSKAAIVACVESST